MRVEHKTAAGTSYPAPTSFCRSLLIVDDDELLAAAMRRRLSGFFDRIVTAASAKIARRHLSSTRFTHVLCDLNLGDGTFTGANLIARWRAEHGAIRRAILYTGEMVPRRPWSPGVDAVVRKEDPQTLVLQALFADGWSG